MLAALMMLLLPASLAAGPLPSGVVPSEAVRAALVETADVIDHVLLDESGRARGDYDWQRGRWSEYEVAWHTGQAIEALLVAHAITGDQRYLDRARRAGDWWVSLEIRDGPLAGMVNAAHGDRLGSLINFTTVGNGTPGLFRLSRVSGDSRYADTAARAIVWLARNTAVPGQPGLYYNIIDPKTGAVWRDRTPHRATSAPAITEVARPNIEGSPFLDACEHLGADWLCRTHDALAQHTAACQDANGLWMRFEPNNAADGTVHPRFNSWNAEAMLRAWRRTGDQRLLAASIATARANQRLIAADGAFDYDQSLAGPRRATSPTGSATAFAGLLWLGLREAGHTEFDASIHAAARWLIANRYPLDHPDPQVRGLVVERRIKGGRVIQRDLGTIFAVRFFAAYLKAFP